MGPEFLPEERLLNLIKSGKREESIQIANKKKKSSNEEQKKTKISFLILINYFFIISAIMLFSYFAYELSIAKRDFPGDLVQIQPRARSKQDEGFIQSHKPFSDYEIQFSRRDLFEQPQDSIAEDPGEINFIKHLRLVGIVLGETSEAIVEDTQAKTTLFLREGDRVGEIEVIHIQQGKIIFSYQQETLELSQ